MRAVFHKLYLITQALILIAGTALFIWGIYSNFYGLETGTYDNARDCALRSISKDFPLGAIGQYSDKWTRFVRFSVSSKLNFEAMKAEGDRITKACSRYLLVDVSKSGDVSLFLVSKNGYKPAWEMQEIPYAFGVILGGTALLSVLLFLIRKWIGIVFRPEKSV